MSVNQEALHSAFTAFYEDGVEPHVAAAWLEQNAGRDEAKAFMEVLAQEEAEPPSPAEYLAARAAEDAELERVAARVQQAQADNVQAEAYRRAGMIDGTLRSLPRGEEIVQHVYERFNKQGGDVVEGLTDAYLNVKTEADVVDEAVVHAELQKPFRSTQMADGWLQKTPTNAERFPTKQSVAAQREAETMARAENIYAENKNAAVAARLTPLRTEQDEQDLAVERFDAANQKRWSAVEKPDAERLTASQSTVKAFEQGLERSTSFKEQSHARQIEAVRNRPDRAWWLESEGEPDG